MPWPPRSPDLTPCDFFLWGFVQSKMYVDSPSTIQELEAKITARMQSIPQDLIDSSIKNYEKRINQLIDNVGAVLKLLCHHYDFFVNTKCCSLRFTTLNLKCLHNKTIIVDLNLNL